MNPMADNSLNHRDISRASFAEPASPRGKEADIRECYYQGDEERKSDSTGRFNSDTPSIHRGDFRRKQEFHGFDLLRLVYQSTGVIYGDIGTSPLYVYSSTFTSSPSYDDLLGVLSLIIWTLTFMVSIKYVLIVLLADDEGGGGTFALYSLLCRYANIIKRDREYERSVEVMRYSDEELTPSNRRFRSLLESSAVAHAILKVVAVLGVCLMIADGVLTPAQSVLGAIQGLKVANPSLSSSTIVGISCVILILLFFVQPFGTTKIANSFAPVVIIWLLFNFSLGIYNLAVHDHSVLKAFSPYFAGQYFIRHKTEGWKSLGGILLAFTGVEAMYANLGAFSTRAIQISWLAFAYPCILLAYIGQAAYISDNPNAYSNPFFNTVPSRMYWPGIVISILAAVVGSQAIITGTFQLISQLMALSYFPNAKLEYKSAKYHGQVYIPVANWLLMIGTVIVTVIYSNTTKLGRAYGTCVVLVVFITTCMVAIVAIICWRIHPVVVLAGFLIFASLDGLYLSSALTKVPDGAWFTLMLTVILSSFAFVWRYGKEQQWKADLPNRTSLGELVECGEGGRLRLGSKYGGGELTNIKGVAILFDQTGDLTPLIYSHFLRNFKALHEFTVFFHLHPLPKPKVDAEERCHISRLNVPGNFFRIHVRQGFDDEVINDLGSIINDRLCDFLMRSTGNGVENGLYSNPQGQGGNSRPGVNAWEGAFKTQVVYIVGTERLRIADTPGFFRRLVLRVFIWLRGLSRSKIAQMKLPYDKLFEVGIFKDI